jgi:D-3-phosphoglycerate dehydrogenase / 2-oxoglutarate reductase
MPAEEVPHNDKSRPMTRRVLVTDYAWPTLDIERAVLASVGAELVVAERGDERELTELAPDVDGILTNWKRVPAAAVDVAPRCLVVSRYGVGVDNIPVDHATTLGIVVTNVPDFCVDEVSDHALALLLCCSRRIVAFARTTAVGTWDLEIGRGMRRIRGQCLGLVGYGRLGRALAAKAVPLGLSVLAYSPRLTNGPLTHGVVGTSSLEELLSTADFVSLHVPPTPETRGIIDESALRLMKPSAYLINTARGALVDEHALARAIGEGWIAGAALDVLSVEPPAADNPLLGLDRVIVTPHAAFYSEQSIADVQQRAAENVASVLSGRRPANIVNPAVLQKASSRTQLV